MSTCCLLLQDMQRFGINADLSEEVPCTVKRRSCGRFGLGIGVPYFQDGVTTVTLRIETPAESILTLEAHGFVSRMQKIRARISGSGEFVQSGDELLTLDCSRHDDCLYVRMKFRAHETRNESFFVFCDDGAEAFTLQDMQFEHPVPYEDVSELAEGTLHYEVIDALIMGNYLQIDLEILKPRAELDGLDLQGPLAFELVQCWTGRPITFAANSRLKPRMAIGTLPSPVAMSRFGPTFGDHGISLRALLQSFQDMRYLDVPTSDAVIGDLRIVARFNDGSTHVLPIKSRNARQENSKIGTVIASLVKEGENKPKFLELGGRGNASACTRATLAQGFNYCAVDINPGPNVDIVGDAHKLSQLFPSEHFDVIYSHSVLEHLMAPWQVIIESNRVLKTGGYFVAYVPTTWPLHAEPWDFWRISPHAWPGLMNELTGFEIVEVREIGRAVIVPSGLSLTGATRMQHDPSPLFTSVLARKTGPAQVDWHSDVVQFATGRYGC